MNKEDNPQAFKHWISDSLITKMSKALKGADPSFKTASFQKVGNKLKDLELKARVQLIRDALKDHLPAEYPKALNTLLKSLKSGTLQGFDLWPYTEFVQTYGLNHFDLSMRALYELTQRFTAEFAVRPFIVQDPKASYAQLLKWTQDSNTHVRRWTSEGTRPRLPWGMKLHGAIHDPTEGLKILEKLKWDPELYVRKSVANHLNDIAKDHPKLVVDTLKDWQKNCPKASEAHFDFIQKQALRTLIKKGYKPALKLMGAGEKPQIDCLDFKIDKPGYRVSETLNLQFRLHSKSKKPQKIIVDYIIHFQTARGTHSAKVFKLKTIALKPGETVSVQKNHSLRPITTRKYYPGVHKLEIQANGEVIAEVQWKLRL